MKQWQKINEKWILKEDLNTKTDFKSLTQSEKDQCKKCQDLLYKISKSFESNGMSSSDKWFTAFNTVSDYLWAGMKGNE